MSVAFRPRRASIRRRLLAAFVFLALSMGAALGLAGRLSFDSLGTALLAWHTRPVMDALMEAERRAWEAEDRGGEKLYYGEDLAAVMHWRFLVGKEVPDPWRALPDGLHLTENSRDFVLVARRDNVIYALSGEVGVFAALNQKLTGALLLCALAGSGPGRGAGRGAEPPPHRAPARTYRRRGGPPAGSLAARRSNTDTRRALHGAA